MSQAPPISTPRPIAGAHAGVGGDVVDPSVISPSGSMLERVVNTIASVTSMGALVSIVIHVAISITALLVTVGVAGVGGSRGSGGGDFELVIGPEGELSGILEAAPLDALAPVVMDTTVPELPSAGVEEGAGGWDAPASGPGTGPIESGLGGAGGGDIGSGAGLGAGGSGTGKGASFFGVEAQGSRFLYICDNSGSMNWDNDGVGNGKRLRILKRELTSSIAGLLEHMQFYVVFFNSTAFPINPESTKWLIARETGKRWATDRVAKIEPFGGTEPWPAFEIAFAMKPPPDAIYFMTDGNFDPAIAMRIAQINVGSRKIPIHCITLVDRSGEETMRKIAADSGGTYTHVDGSK
ncbi:MAG: hypothetical protein K2W85_03770 [Phycisphaerales bacterium]|nr:hypothetical protein [Phycisphaerales bacterium]